MQSTRFSRSRTRGSVLPLVMLAMVVLLLTGIGTLRIGQSTRMRAIHAAQLTAARTAADAGLVRALSEMNTQLRSPLSQDFQLEARSTTSLTNCDAEYRYKIAKFSFQGEDAYRIESIGSCGLVERRIEAVVGLVGSFERGVSVEKGISLKSGAVVEAYNAEAGEDLTLVGTLGTEASMIRISPGATIEGDVAVGYGGDPDTVVNYLYRSDITGEIYADAMQSELPAVRLPESVRLLPSRGTLSKSETIQDSGRYKNVKIGQGDTVIIDGPVTMYVDGDAILDNSAQIQINDTNPDASLTLYLGGDLAMKNGGILNNLTEDAKRLKIYGLPTSEKMVFHTAGTFYGAIYAPSADLYAMNSIDIYGSVVGESFWQAAKGDIHFDASLREVAEDDPGRYLAVKRWAEE